MFYFHYTWFLVQNNRPIQDLTLLNDDVLFSYLPIKGLKEELDKLCKTIESLPYSPDLSFRKYQETKIKIDTAHISSAARLLYYLMERYKNAHQEREAIFQS